MRRDHEKLAPRYAKGLLEAVVGLDGEGALNETLAQLENLTALTGEGGRAFFGSPLFRAAEKRAVLERVAEQAKARPSLVRFLELLISHGRLDLLPEIARSFDENLRERRNEVRAGIRTAFPLSPAEHREIAAALGRRTGKKILLEVEVDRDLVGGLVARVGSVYYDASIRGFLERLKQES